ncbi:hypothetical protein PybrP1_009925 [[Pythium] brassicae (nom. inval.)]|nr:hypothetical protein PybrP1_009925 [[Pythium] brassicae (nom. inval.)]
MQLRFPLPTGYFPKFELMPDESMAFQALVSDIVKETRRDQLVFLKNGKMDVDSRMWKIAKSKERLHVYRRRTGANQLGLYGAVESGMSSSLSRSGSESSQDGLPSSRRGGVQTRSAASGSMSSSRGSTSFDQESLASMSISGTRVDEDASRKSIEPSVLGFGILEGSLDDMVYGLLAGSGEEMKSMASFLGDDSLIDCAVLHTLRTTPAMEMFFGLTVTFEAAEAKKVAALVAKQAALPATKAGSTLCSICRAKPGLLSSHSVCQGCGGVICSKCRVRKQTFSRKGKIKVSFCKICLVGVKDKSPFEGLMFERQALTAIKKKPAATPRREDEPERSAPSSARSLHPSDAAKLLKRHNSNTSVTDTEFSSSIQSWPSSSVSSTYSDLDDGYYPTLQQTPENGSQMVVLERRMPGDGPGYGAPQQHSHQLARYGSQGKLTPQNPHKMHYLPNAHQQQQQQQQQYGYSSQQAPMGGMPHSNANQSRAGLYNQMLELQMAAERAYNLANQNATYMQHQQQQR